MFSRRLKVSSVFDSLIAASNSFQIVGAVKLKVDFIGENGISQKHLN